MMEGRRVEDKQPLILSKPCRSGTKRKVPGGPRSGRFRIWLNERLNVMLARCKGR
jgi:hypothetical protein